MDLPKDFQNHLLTDRRVSQKTLRCYSCDLAHFVKWASNYISSQGQAILSINDILPRFTGSLVASYKGYHLENKIPCSTTNRRLSTLRNFTKFLHQKGLIAHNPAQALGNLQKDTTYEENIEKTIGSFKKHLLDEGASKTTLKNYASDIRNFLVWTMNSS